MKTSALIANGSIQSYEKMKPLILKHRRIVAADGGLEHCHKMGIQPHLVVGDFDSCPKELLKQCESIPKISLSQEKDETDLEVAIDHEFKEGAEEITLFAAWGKRIDHSLTNALFLGRYPGKIKLETEEEILFAIQGKTMFPCHRGQTVSLLPIYGPAQGITTSGLQWELQNRTLDLNFVGISNICLKTPIEISIEQGLLLCSLVK